MSFSAAELTEIRRDFPILGTEVHGKPLVYFDNAASAQKPRQVLDRIAHYYAHEYSNVHRGVHHLSMVGTEAYEGARGYIAESMGAKPEDIIFTRGGTESINLVARTYGETLQLGDVVVLTEMEHHANLVPWHLLSARRGVELRFIPMNEEGELVLDNLEQLLEGPVRLLSFVHTSNSLGTVNPTSTMIEAARSKGILTLVDGAQLAPHAAIDVGEIGCDMLAFSGHKVFGPMGSGILYMRKRLADTLPPFHGGGDMIDVVELDHSTYAASPLRFEAGTPNVAAGLGLEAAFRYIRNLGMERIGAHEAALRDACIERIKDIDGLRIVGNPKERSAVIPFVVEGTHPHDIGTLLDQQGVAIRTGHHCTQPLLRRLGLQATARASLAFYNSVDEIDVFGAALERAVSMLRG